MVFANPEITCSAPGTVMVISTIGIPPLRTASAAKRASSEEEARMTGMTPKLAICSLTDFFFMYASASRSADNSRSRSFHYLQDFVQGSHGSVSRRGHGQGAVGGAALDGPLRTFSGEESIDQARGEGIATTNPNEDLEVFAGRGLKKIAIGVADCAPIVPGGGWGCAEGSAAPLEKKKRRNLAKALSEHTRERDGKRVCHS